MNESPLVSILLLSMNHQPFIEKCIDSLKKQTYRNIEIIYLDNASSDNTFRTGKRILERSGIPYKTFINKESRGISANVNFLFNHSKGLFIIPLSTDDWLTSDNIEEKINYFKKHPEFGMVYNNAWSYNYDTGEKKVCLKKNRFKGGWVLKEILKKNFISTAGCMIQRRTLETVGLFDENSLLEDWDMWIRIAEKFPIGFIDKELAFYGIKEGVNTTGNIEYLSKGYAYVQNKYSHYKEIQESKKYIARLESYYYASKEPSLKSLLFILKNCRFNFFYFKQTIKTIIGIVKIYLSGKDAINLTE
jgi:glycosyltransferase involved in cell wall biosynthesis